MVKNKSVSVIIPCFNEERYIEGCLNSIIEQDYGLENIEIIVVDGISDDRTVELIKRFSCVTLCFNIDKIVPISMNIGIKKAKGDFIVRIDAHCIYPINYISALIKNSLIYEADNVGAVVRTVPANDSAKAQAIAISMSHPLGVGNSYFRIGSDRVREVDTVPFGCYRKDVFNLLGLYDEELVRNQDDELNGRLKQNGGKIILIPDLVIDYFARDKFSKLYRMFYQYGLFKPLVNKKLISPTTFRQFVPLLFVSGILFGLILGIFYPLLFQMTLSGLLIYFGVILLTSLRTIYKKKLKIITIPYLVGAFYMIHLSYGFGYIRGLIDLFIKNLFVKVPDI
jgi:glycosyltransferase involved in cell wall biosynthesis